VAIVHPENVLEPLAEKPHHTIIQLATGGVMVAAVHVPDVPLTCTLLVPIGIP
jgi:hypothetical protein